jgi:hypothetical protein
MGVPAFQKGEDEGSLETNRISLSYYLFRKKYVLLEIFSPLNRIDIYEKKGKDKKMDDIKQLQKVLAKKLVDQIGEENLALVDEKNKGLQPYQDSIYKYIEVSELENIFATSCQELGYDWHRVVYLGALINLRNDGYLRK